MANNRQAKEELIRKYGAECFIERLHLRDTKGLKYKGKGQYRKMKMLTYHHIKPKSKGGQATVDNGAILSNENHAWFHKQPKGKQQEMNKKFQEFKRDVDEIKLILVDDVDVDFKVVASILELDEKGRIKQERKDSHEEANKKGNDYIR